MVVDTTRPSMLTFASFVFLPSAYVYRIRVQSWMESIQVACVHLSH